MFHHRGLSNNGRFVVEGFEVQLPREWVFVDALPMTASGKVQMFALREQF